MQLTPKFFLPLMKTNSFLYYFSEKIISIDKIPPILQAFKFVISCPATEHGGIWVGPLLTSSKDIAQNTQATFDWVSSAVKTYLGYLCFIFLRKWTRLLYERSESSSNTIWSLATISMATMYLYNNPSYSRILIGSCLWSIRGQTHDWRHHCKAFPSAF